jgi:multiple antibiotic resistance protein
MRTWPEYSNFFLSLLVIINPILAVPLFLGYTRGQSPAERRRTALTTSATVLAALVVAALTGESLLRIFGTSLGSFRVGGGIVLFLMALVMLRVHADSTGFLAGAGENERRTSVAVVPLAIPLLAGPGAIGAVIVAMTRSSDVAHAVLIVGTIAASSIVLWLVLRAAEPIGRTFGPIGIDVINRLFGLLLAAFATEMVAGGLKQLFPVLAG